MEVPCAYLPFHAGPGYILDPFLNTLDDEATECVLVELGFGRSWCITGRKLASDSGWVVARRVWRARLLELTSLLVGTLMSSWVATCATEFLDDIRYQSNQTVWLHLQRIDKYGGLMWLKRHIYQRWGGRARLGGRWSHGCGLSIPCSTFIRWQKGFVWGRWRGRSSRCLQLRSRGGRQQVSWVWSCWVCWSVATRHHIILRNDVILSEDWKHRQQSCITYQVWCLYLPHCFSQRHCSPLTHLLHSCISPFSISSPPWILKLLFCLDVPLSMLDISSVQVYPASTHPAHTWKVDKPPRQMSEKTSFQLCPTRPTPVGHNDSKQAPSMHFAYKHVSSWLFL